MQRLKLEAARRQLGAALSLYLSDDDPVSVMCLAGGGCEVMDHLARKAGGKPFVSHMLAIHPDLKLAEIYRLQRQYWNAFKHAERDDESLLANFDDKQNDHMLFIGWYDYAQAEKALPIEAQVHQVWYLALYPEKLNPKFPRDQYEKLFPNLKNLPRAEQKLRLRTAIKRARSDTKTLRDPRTEKRPLVLGWPPN